MFHKVFHRNVNILPLYTYLRGKKNVKHWNHGLKEIPNFQHPYSWPSNIKCLKDDWLQIPYAWSL